MKETTKRKLFGKRLYSIYRRMRFLSYKRKKLKLEKKQNRKEEIQAQKEARKKNKNSIGFRIYRIFRLLKYVRKRRKHYRHQKKFNRKTQKAEKRELKKRLKLKAREDRLLDKQKSRFEKLELKEEKKERKRIRKEWTRSHFKTFIFEIKSFNRHSIKRWYYWFLTVTENRDKRNNFFVITLNSLVYFVLSYLVIYVISQIVTVWIATSFDYKTIMYYYKIYYNIESSDWTADSVKILFSIMPLTGLLLGVIFIIIYSTFRNETGKLKLFFLWGFVHGMVMFFGALLLGTLLNKDFGWVIAYLYYRDTGKMIFSIISIFALISIGAIISRSFLISGNSYFNFINESNKKYFLYSQVIFPGIIGSILLVFLKIPNSYYYVTTDEVFFEIMKLSTLIILIIPLIMTFGTYSEVLFDEEPRRVNLKWKLMIVTYILAIAFRFGFPNGIYFE